MKPKKNSKFAVNIQIPRRVTIKVTKKDIQQGEYGSGSNCPIALAVKRTLGDHPDVPGEYFDVTMQGMKVSYTLPKKADVFIETFDDIENWAGSAQEEKSARKKLKPFSFVAEYKSHETETD